MYVQGISPFLVCWFIPTCPLSLPLSRLSQPALINLPTAFHLCSIVSISFTESSARMFKNSIPLSFYWRQWGHTEKLTLFCWYTKKNAKIHLRWHFTLGEMLLHVCCVLALIYTLSHLHSHTHTHTAKCPWPGCWTPHGSWCCVFIVLTWKQTLFSSPAYTDYWVVQNRFFLSVWDEPADAATRLCFSSLLFD